jgi:hypothetical protein
LIPVSPRWSATAAAAATVVAMAVGVVVVAAAVVVVITSLLPTQLLLVATVAGRHMPLSQCSHELVFRYYPVDVDFPLHLLLLSDIFFVTLWAAFVNLTIDSFCGLLEFTGFRLDNHRIVSLMHS